MTAFSSPLRKPSHILYIARKPLLGTKGVNSTGGEQIIPHRQPAAPHALQQGRSLERKGPLKPYRRLSMDTGKSPPHPVPSIYRGLSDCFEVALCVDSSLTSTPLAYVANLLYQVLTNTRHIYQIAKKSSLNKRIASGARVFMLPCPFQTLSLDWT